MKCTTLYNIRSVNLFEGFFPSSWFVILPVLSMSSPCRGHRWHPCRPLQTLAFPQAFLVGWCNPHIFGFTKLILKYLRFGKRKATSFDAKHSYTQQLPGIASREESFAKLVFYIMPKPPSAGISQKLAQPGHLSLCWFDSTFKNHPVVFSCIASVPTTDPGYAATCRFPHKLQRW